MSMEETGQPGELPVDTSIAPEVGATAAPTEAPSQSADGDSKPEEKTEAKPKAFSQEEVEAIVQKRIARAERKLQREFEQRMAQAQTPKQPQVAPAERPDPGKFQSSEEYVEAVAEWKARQIVESTLTESQRRAQEQQQQRIQAEVVAEFQEREEVARDKYADFDQVAYNPQLPITNEMAEAIRSSELGPDIAYFLGKNADECARIARLTPFLQAKELGKLEAKLQAAPVATPRTSSAPEPITPVTPSGGKGFTSLDDPKALKSLGTSGLIEAWRRDALKRAQAGTR